MHEYDANDISSCLEHRSIVFLGDSTTRNIFWAMARKLDPGRAAEKESTALKHEDQSFIGAGIPVKFIWDPFLNSSNLNTVLVACQDSGSTGEQLLDEKVGPAILLIGGGLWHAKHLVSTYIDDFKRSVNHIINSITPGSSVLNLSSSKEVWKMPASGDFLAIAPVQVPSYEALHPSIQETLSPSRIESLNKYLQHISPIQGVSILWSYSLMTLHTDSAYDGLGLHVNGNIASRKADVLLNMRCNEKLMKSDHYPMDKTCCARYPRPNSVQLMIASGSLAIVLLGSLSSIGGVMIQWIPQLEITLAKITGPKQIILTTFLKVSYVTLPLAFALCYSYFADRTHFFGKAQKEYSPVDFRLLCLFTLTLGILSIRRSSSPAQKMTDQSFLSRDQTDEWKGWMQFIILIYHYTGASKILEIYAFIRILVASYLYMTGFGHTMFFYQKKDYSLRRCASVLIRLNLLTSILPYVMGTDYLFYYFAPLISFWYLVIYLTMRVGCTKNTSIVFIGGKILISAVLTTTLTRTPGVFEKIFFFLEKSCRIHWNVTEWRFRLQLDAYIVYVGMICGILCINISSVLRGDPTELKVFSFIRQYWRLVRLTAVGLALIILPTYWHLARRSQNKYSYNRWVPFVSCLPILSFVILRNHNRHARNFHSSVFAWLGRHSLETFTLQFHIWLAADTKGLLALNIFGGNQNYINGRWAEFALLTVIFLWVSWHVATTTTLITSWIIDPSAMRSNNETEGADSKMKLPQTKVYVHLDKPLRDETDQRKWKARLYGFLKEDLRVRLAIISGGLWCLNQVANYPSA